MRIRRTISLTRASKNDCKVGVWPPSCNGCKKDSTHLINRSKHRWALKYRTVSMIGNTSNQKENKWKIGDLNGKKRLGFIFQNWLLTFNLPFSYKIKNNLSFTPPNIHTIHSAPELSEPIPVPSPTATLLYRTLKFNVRKSFEKMIVCLDDQSIYPGQYSLSLEIVEYIGYSDLSDVIDWIFIFHDDLTPSFFTSPNFHIIQSEL